MIQQSHARTCIGQKYDSKNACTPMFTITLLTAASPQKQPKCPSTEEWIKKMWCIYTMDYYSTIKKEWNNAICRDMDRLRDCYTEGRKLEREKYIISLICGIYKNGID